ncbi:hypothetical protein [Pseudomonas aeruginosa]|uniref:hypothetical protein n=1 Tax=Pseudomonas aeruginosa TaxID=287 RepID=UPI001F066F7A|nr:hypothetical protein [Pseudomonas aeruginosa]MCH0754243.1 hypothetical protein [Pseudomonas aeruginosa]
MKERPILFNDQMVRAILDGRKTVTRRVMKYQPHEDASVTVGNYNVTVVDRHGEQQPGPEAFGAWWSDGERGCICPHGEPGDRLWVREAWAADAQVDAIAPSDLSQGEPIWYPADLSVRQTGCSMISKGRVRPSIHMPRWASRILLEITAVRVERLHDLSDPGALAEGVSHNEMHSGDSLVDVFARLWESTGGDWAANPWVWVVEFKRVTP